MTYTNPLAQRMEILALKDRDLANKVGCTRVAITKMRLGYTRPSMGMAKKLSEHTGLSLERLAEMKVTKGKKDE